MMTEEPLYKVEIEWNEGRRGTMSSPKLSQKIEVATPPEFPGGVEGIWSPEHLFVAAVSSCFMTTFTAIAENSKLDFDKLEIKAFGRLGKCEGKFMITEIILRPKLVITDEQYFEKANRILEKAETACLISRSVKSKFIFEPEVVIAAYS